MDTTEKEFVKVSIGHDVLKECCGILEKGGDYHRAMEGFNLLLNETIHKKGEVDILLFYLGGIHMKMGYTAMAIFLFKKAMEMRKDFVAAINNLGYLFKKEGLQEQSLDCFKEVIRIIESNEQEIPDHDKVEYYVNMGSGYIASGTPDTAMGFFEKAAKIDPTKDILLWNRSLAHLEKGEYEIGFKEYEHGERGDLSTRRTYQVKDLPNWDGSPGKNIIVYGEQGIGDEIMFASMLEDLGKDTRFVLDAHPRLADMFRLNFPGIPIYGTRKRECDRIAWLPFHKYDAKIAIGSLAKFYRKKEEDFPKKPYIKCRPDLKQKYETIFANMGDRPKIGFSWRGGIKSTNGNSRYIPLEKWLDIFRLDADFISLQYHRDSDKVVREFEDKHDVKLNHWQKILNDYDETAGLVENLDLIISVPQSVVHLAGAMGKLVWQLAPKRAMWQVGPYGKDMPWYPHAHNIWQTEDGNWDDVMIRVKDEICNLLQMNTEN